MNGLKAKELRPGMTFVMRDTTFLVISIESGHFNDGFSDCDTVTVKMLRSMRQGSPRRTSELIVYEWHPDILTFRNSTTGHIPGIET